MRKTGATGVQERIQIDLGEGTQTGWRWRNEDKPPLLFLHATGFCASAYQQMLSHLADDFDVTALDLRGHGCNSLPADPSGLASWAPYIGDVRAFLALQDRSGWTLTGHSMGATTALMAARGRSDVSALALIEPVAMPRWFSRMARTPVWPVLAQQMPLVRMAQRRRARWPKRDDAVSSYSGKALFKSWAPGVLEDYLQDGLAEEEETVKLACAPAWEAATFAAQANDFWAASRTAPAPVHVFAADHRSSTLSPFARRRLNRLGAAVTLASGVTHLAPMEKPAELAEFLAGAGRLGAKSAGPA